MYDAFDKADKYRLKVSSFKRGDEYPQKDIDRVVGEMMESGRRDTAFMSVEFQSFCRRIYELGMADVVELIGEGARTVALNFILRMGERRLSWIFLYTNPHASTELYVKYFYELLKRAVCF
jgi:hypothetical protein